MNILHICAGWEKWNGAANIARMIMGEQSRDGHDVSFATWASIRQLRSVDEVWIHCGWLPCLWWAVLWGRNVHWMPEACYDPVRLKYHGWKKRLAGPIERFSLRRAKVIVATCEAEKGWIQSYLGKHCPPVVVTDIKRFFNLNPVNPVNHVKKDLHLLYLGRQHPLKGLEFLEEAVRQISSVPHSPFPVPPQLKVVSNAFGEEKEKVWKWCDVLVLPTLSDNFGLVIAEALERGKRVITTDGAPVWGEGLTGFTGLHSGYGGRLIYLIGYRGGSDETRVELLKKAIERICQ
ncbi:MAG: glycosyltransferase family 4 protein [Kiritimatiellae bacterium]|nr:glycosyltransferase family 4 protein [Kiritimatiellia bacterium]